MTNNTDSPTEVETGSYLSLPIPRTKKEPRRDYPEPEEVYPWFEKNGIRLEYYNLAGRETQGVVDSSNAAGMEGMESIAKTLAAEDEDIWMELQYFRDHSHCKEVYAKMMTDRSLEPLLNEFFGLIIQGRGLITGGFNRLRH
jgi:hypothetical protein